MYLPVAGMNQSQLADTFGATGTVARAATRASTFSPTRARR